ncbi:hypothetical protein [Butyrivibrio sp. AE2032]|uniref:hypothetical protein n=1 Tax=Butyrivibrio sp. AE2032 TaxID=1458463 RepID=UPI00054EFAEA|nr:hypothetical protein [Butyrivibrio sp. AE2032]
MDFKQACFTRIGGQGSGDGWQLVNCSPTLSDKDSSYFSSIQNANITPPVFDPEDSQTKIVEEFVVNQDSVFLTKIKYDVGTDPLGRSISFAHSYVFGLNDYAHKPQEVLFAADSNFHFSVDTTKEIPASLEMMEVLSLKECVENVGLTKETYKKLMRCVFYILDSKSRDILHIICDCKSETIARILMCILSAMPIEYRKRVTYSTYLSRDSAYKAIIFDRTDKAKGEYFFNIKTGANNVLSDILIKKMKRYGFIDVIPEGYDTDMSPEFYFENLDIELKKFVDRQPITLELYRVAYEIMMATANGNESDAPEDYLKRLNNLLNVPLVHPYIDQQIQYALSDIMERGIIIPKMLEEKVHKRLSETRNDNLKSCGQQFIVDKMLEMSSKDAAQMLNKEYGNNKDEYKNIEELLKKNEKGQEILDYAFVLKADDVVPDEEHIIAFYRDTLSIKDRDIVCESLFVVLKRYIDKITSEKKKPGYILDVCYRLMSSVGIYDEQKRLSLVQYLKQKYWDNYNLEDFDFGQDYLNSYVIDAIMLPSHKKCIVVDDLFNMLESFLNYRIDILEKLMEKYFASHQSPLSFSQQKIIEEKLLNECLRLKGDRRVSGKIDNWICLLHGFTQMKENPIKVLMNAPIGSFTLSFDIACENSRLLSDEKYWNWFMDNIRTYKPEGKTEEHLINEVQKIMSRKKKGGVKPSNSNFGYQSGVRPSFVPANSPVQSNGQFYPFVPNNAGSGIPDNQLAQNNGLGEVIQSAFVPLTGNGEKPADPVFPNSDVGVVSNSPFVPLKDNGDVPTIPNFPNSEIEDKDNGGTE